MNKERKTMIRPTKEFGYKQPKLRQFKYLTGKELIVFFMDRFDFTADEAIRMEMKMPGGFKVQVI